jgi:hypothetical protein
MKDKLNCNTLCILLGVILIAILLRASTNKGRLWGKGDEYYGTRCFSNCPNGCDTMDGNCCKKCKPFQINKYTDPSISSRS